MVERDRRRRHLLVAEQLAARGAAVIADHAQHVLAVLLVAREGAEEPRHLGRGRVGDAGHDRGERAADRAAFLRIVGDAGRHQQAADIGVAEAERAVFVGELRDLLRRKLRHQHRDFEHDGPQPHRVLVALDVEGKACFTCAACSADTSPWRGRSDGEGVRVGTVAVSPLTPPRLTPPAFADPPPQGRVRAACARRRLAERQQVQRREVTRRVVEEHVFRARIATRGFRPTPGRCASR